MNLRQIAAQYGFRVAGRVGLETHPTFEADKYVVRLDDRAFIDRCEHAMHAVLRQRFSADTELSLFWDRQIGANILAPERDDGRNIYLSVGFHGFEKWEEVDPMSLDDARQYRKIPVELGLTECACHPCRAKGANDFDKVAKEYIEKIDDLPQWLAQHIVKAYSLWYQHVKDPGHPKR